MLSCLRYAAALLAILATLTGAPVLAEPLPPGTRVNCAASQFIFGPDAVLASSGDALFEFTGSGWQRLPTPGAWDQVRRAYGDVIYLYDNPTNTIYRSGDGGQSWTQVAVAPFSHEGAEALYPSPVIGTLFMTVTDGSSPDRTGIWKSVDGGATWRGVYAPGGALPVTNPIAFSPAFYHDGVAFAAESGRGTFAGLRKTTDAGETWQPANAGLQAPAQSSARLWLAVSPGFPQDQTAFSVGGPFDFGFYKTTNGGQAWQYINALRPAWLALSPDYPTDQTALIADPGAGVYQSGDGGATWANVYVGSALLTGISRAAPGGLDFWAVVQGNQPGVCHLYHSPDGGATWELQTLFDLTFAAYLPLIGRQASHP